MQDSAFYMKMQRGDVRPTRYEILRSAAVQNDSFDDIFLTATCIGSTGFPACAD
jgi:hypothetical protein